MSQKGPVLSFENYRRGSGVKLMGISIPPGFSAKFPHVQERDKEKRHF